MPNFQTPDPDSHNELRRLLLVMVMVVGGSMVWQHFFPPAPMPARPPAATAVGTLAQGTSPTAGTPLANSETPADLTHEQALRAAGARLPIRSAQLHGSLALKGARFDDITLVRYHETVDPRSPEITLLSPSATAQGYFAEFGWLSEDGVAVPDGNTVWKTDATEIRPHQPVVLWWENGQGLRFERHLTLDSQSMFTVEQRVLNRSGHILQLTPFGRIQRRIDDTHIQHYAISHEGPLGVLGNELHEVSYKELREKGPKTFPTQGGWLGFGDKYWLTAAVLDQGPAQAKFSLVGGSVAPAAQPGAHPGAVSVPRYQADFSGAPLAAAAGGSLRSTAHFFAGAKEVTVLDNYATTGQVSPKKAAELKQYATTGVPLFDRAVDFGVLYFLTKPIFKLLNFFYGLIGNFGLAILLLTVVVKGLMFPLANKSYRAMNAMKKLQPEMEKLKTKHGEDKMRLQQEMMALYKKERVSPASGCLPMFIQIPVFFSLYKVLFVTIEMRHAPFFGWIHDLSAPDPSNVWTLFGALPWQVPNIHVLVFQLSPLGWWPLAYCLTMYLQQRFQPKPADPMQARLMSGLPFILLFLFAAFPAGLVIYWTWSNTLTIFQQWFINRLHRNDAAPSPSDRGSKQHPAKKSAPKKKTTTIIKPAPVRR